MLSRRRHKLSGRSRYPCWVEPCVLLVSGAECKLVALIHLRRIFFFYVLNLFFARIVWRAKVIGNDFRSGSFRGGDRLQSYRVDRSGLRRLSLQSPGALDGGVGILFVPGAGLVSASFGGDSDQSRRSRYRFDQAGDSSCPGSGELVGMFPRAESTSRRICCWSARSGAALVALKARVPIIPCYLSGSPNDGTDFGCFFMWAKAKIIVGRPIDISEYYGDVNEPRSAGTTHPALHAGDCPAGWSIQTYEPTLAGRALETNARIGVGFVVSMQ